MRVLQKYEESHRWRTAGSVFLLLSILTGLSIPFCEDYRVYPNSISSGNPVHQESFIAKADSLGFSSKTYTSLFVFVRDIRSVIHSLQNEFSQSESPNSLDQWQVKEYLFQISRSSATGVTTRHPLLFFIVILMLGIISGACYSMAQLRSVPGDNNGIYHSALTKGISQTWRNAFIIIIGLASIVYGYYYLQKNWIWPVLTLVCAFVIVALVKNEHSQSPNRNRNANSNIHAWISISAGLGLILFYVIIYWAPWYATPWMTITDPLSKMLSGNPASQWFLYGLLYTLVVLIMGVRMIVKYRHHTYQMIRTCSVMFFQLGFAFLIPEVLVRLNQPYFDFKNIWPLNYTFFFDWNLNTLLHNGGLGLFMLVWGIALIVIAVPVFTYFFGKRWYCSWVCGCGGLAETFGDPFRQLSDKSVKAWKYERWIIHGVLVFAVVMTAMVLYTYFTGSYQVLFLNSDSVRTWYGFLVGSAFAGVVGTGFYPLMGNRVWCRFGCPLAAYLGLIQRFKSRFRITVNGGQCISCGNCSTYCEMGIDVRAYAQRGQDVVRASCVGCGICASVCPRGVLRLENANPAGRAAADRAIHIQEGDVRLLS